MVQQPGQVPPPGVADHRQAVGGGRRQVDPRLPQPVQLVQIAPGVQGGILRPLQLHGTAQGPGGLPLGRLPAQPLLLGPERVAQPQLPRLEGLDVLQRKAQGPEQLDPPQGFHIGLGIVPVAVGQPLR